MREGLKDYVITIDTLWNIWLKISPTYYRNTRKTAKNILMAREVIILFWMLWNVFKHFLLRINWFNLSKISPVWLISGRAYVLLILSNPLVYGLFMTEWEVFLQDIYANLIKIVNEVVKINCRWCQKLSQPLVIKVRKLNLS